MQEGDDKPTASWPPIPSLSEDDGVLKGQDIILPARADRPYPIRGHYWPASLSEQQTAKGKVVILPGFTEFCEKYSHFMGYLSQMGFDCLVIDWPGQGASGHLGAHPLVVHIDDFSQFHAGIRELIAEAGFSGQPFHVIGHSMGGHLALHSHLLFPYEVEQIILLAPMIVPKAPPLWCVLLASRLMIWAGMSKRALPGSHYSELPEARRFKIDNMLTSDPDGFDRQYRIFEKKPFLRRNLPSIGWINAAFRSCQHTTLNPEWMRQIQVPVTAFLAGDEKIVDGAKSLEMLSYISGLKQHIFPAARHELLQEALPVRSRVFQMIAEQLHHDQPL